MRKKPIYTSLLFVLGCAPELSVKASRITAARVVAVRAEPAEVRPGEPFTLTATVASPGATDARIDWRVCETPRDTTSSTTVSPACLGEAAPSEALPSHELRVDVTMPSDACMRVGPQVPPAGEDGVRTRAPDADLTGGWQMPVRLDLTAGAAQETLFARVRVRCQPPDVPGSTAQGYAQRYVNNRNPTLDAVFDATGGDVRELSRESPNVTSRDALLVAHWTSDSAERYVRVEPTTRALDERTESLEIAWFTDGGSFARDRTAPDGASTTSQNTLHLDASTHSATVWIVLRDERGGVDVVTLSVRDE